MNAIAPSRATRLPALSQPLAMAVDAELRRPPPHPDIAEPPRTIAPHLAAEAERMARAAQSAMMPASASDIAVWIGPLNAACRNPQSSADIAAWSNGVCFACDRIPAPAFSVDALRDLMAKSAFFPAAADVIAIVQPEANRLAGKLRALRAIAARPTSAPPQPIDEKPFAMTDEQKQALRLMKSGKPAAHIAIAHTPANPRHLIAAYRAQLALGGHMAPLAATRLDRLLADFPDLCGREEAR